MKVDRIRLMHLGKDILMEAECQLNLILSYIGFLLEKKGGLC